MKTIKSTIIPLIIHILVCDVASILTFSVIPLNNPSAGEALWIISALLWFFLPITLNYFTCKLFREANSKIVAIVLSAHLLLTAVLGAVGHLLYVSGIQNIKQILTAITFNSGYLSIMLYVMLLISQAQLFQVFMYRCPNCKRIGGCKLIKTYKVEKTEEWECGDYYETDAHKITDKSGNTVGYIQTKGRYVPSEIYTHVITKNRYVYKCSCCKKEIDLRYKKQAGYFMFILTAWNPAIYIYKNRNKK